MTNIQEPQGIDAFAEGLSSFDNQEVLVKEQPTAAVESASLNVKKQMPSKKVTIVEPEVESSKEDSAIDQLKEFYEENQALILASLAVGIGLYVYKKNKK